jgi:formyltetrahydrofolate deformylase
VAAVTRFIADHRGNIVDLEQHVAREESTFFMRIEFDLGGFGLSPDTFNAAFGPVAAAFDMTWDLRQTAYRPRMALFVTRETHCVYDILARHRSGEWAVDIPLWSRTTRRCGRSRTSSAFRFISFRSRRRPRARRRNANWSCFGTPASISFVLARYMQIISAEFVRRYPNRILNIHHSFRRPSRAPSRTTPPTSAAS